jgi:hypothetical protein
LVDLCGPFSFDIRAWDREAKILSEYAAESHLPMTAAEIRETLDQANGLFVYRDHFLVTPKRDEDRDWLGLEARRVNNPTKNLGLAQIVGAVKISRAHNPSLRDKSDREGLVENPASRQFSEALVAVLHVL